LDSLAVVELYLTLQEHWNVPLDDSDANNELTVDDVARTVDGLLGADPDGHDAGPVAGQTTGQTAEPGAGPGTGPVAGQPTGPRTGQTAGPGAAHA
jgi:hypothetical protein